METCPHCGQPSLFINKDWSYECLNPKCEWAFKESDIPRWQPKVNSMPYGPFMGDESWTARLEGSPNIQHSKKKRTSLIRRIGRTILTLFR